MLDWKVFIVCSSKKDINLDYYAKDPMRIIEISFPIFGSAMSGTRTPEDVIEIAYQQLVDGGTVRFKARNGEEFCVDK